MRWRKKHDEVPDTPATDVPQFEDPTDSWAGDLPASSVESSGVIDSDRDTWDGAETPPPPPPAAALDVDDGGVPAMAAAARPDVPVNLGVTSDEDLQRALRRIVARSLAEDLGPAGDVTSIATVSPAVTGVADIVAREAMVVAGVAAVVEVFRQLDPRVSVTVNVEDGDDVAAGTVLATVTGPLRTMLTGERTALNLLGRLSGVASMARLYAKAVAGTGAAVRDTRKTTPGLRLLEKAAVAAGGGANHRVGLHDALLVKDNHVLAAGSVKQAARAAVARSGGRHVQVEVTSIDEIEDVIEAGVVDILLDNFSIEGLKAAVEHVDGRAALEASGGVTLANIADVAATGVDRIATGAMTHQATWMDVAMDVTSVDPGRLATVMPPIRTDTRAVPGAVADASAATDAADDGDADDSSPLDDVDDTDGHDAADDADDDAGSSPLDDAEATDDASDDADDEQPDDDVDGSSPMDDAEATDDELFAHLRGIRRATDR